MDYTTAHCISCHQDYPLSDEAKQALATIQTTLGGEPAIWEGKVLTQCHACAATAQYIAALELRTSKMNN